MEFFSFTPEDIIISAFVFLQKDELSIDELVGVALRGNCPSRKTAEGVVSQMVKRKELKKVVIGKETLYKVGRPLRNRH